MNKILGYVSITFTILLLGNIVAAMGATEIYHVYDGPGLDNLPSQPVITINSLKGLMDILETWLEVSQGTIYSYIKLNTHISPLSNNLTYDFRYVVGGTLKSGDEVKNFTAELAIGRGGMPVIVACSLASENEATENLGRVEVVGEDTITLKIRCDFPDESFTKPDPDMQSFKAVSIVEYSLSAWGDTAALSKQPSNPPPPSTSNPPVSEGGGGKGESEGGGGGQLPIIPIVVAAAVILAAIGFYFTKIRK